MHNLNTDDIGRKSGDQEDCAVAEHESGLNMRIGARARALREHKGWTLRQLAEHTRGRVPFGNLSALERGERTWQPHHLEAVGEALGVEPRDLVPPLGPRDNPADLQPAEQELLAAVHANDALAVARAIVKLEGARTPVPEGTDDHPEDSARG